MLPNAPVKINHAVRMDWRNNRFEFTKNSPFYLLRRGSKQTARLFWHTSPSAFQNREPFSAFFSMTPHADTGTFP
jgi:hypothetical protein